MRNLSMKKFGTPIGAAPGVLSEKVGLLSEGEPSGLRPGAALATWSATCFARFLALRLAVSVFAPPVYLHFVHWSSWPPPVTGLAGTAPPLFPPPLPPPPPPPGIGLPVGFGRLGRVGVGTGTCGSC